MQAAGVVQENKMIPHDRYKAAWNKWSRCGNINCPNADLNEMALMACITCRKWTPRKHMCPSSRARDPYPLGTPSHSESESPLDQVKLTDYDIRADLEGIGLGGYI